MCATKGGFGTGGFGGNDVMEIEILADGTIKTTTDPVSGANHANAEEFLKFVGRLAGGEVTREKRKDRQHHHHHTHRNTQKA